MFIFPFTTVWEGIYDLPYHAQEAITHFGGVESMTTLDSVLLAAMEMDMSLFMDIFPTEMCVEVIK